VSELPRRSAGIRPPSMTTHLPEPRRGPLGVVRDGAFLLGVGLVGLSLAGGVLAADRAVSASLPHVIVTVKDGVFSPADVTVGAGEWTVIELVNQDPVVRDWMVQGVANMDIVTRPGQTADLRFVLNAPGTYPVMTGGSAAGTGGEMAGSLAVEAR
jgi:Cupredoxin-like domain